MVLGIDTETVLEAGSTGLNTRSGDLIIIKFKYMPVVIAGGEPTRIADRTHNVLHYANILCNQ